MSEAEPRIFMPEQAGTALGPAGRKLAFLYVPQLDLEVKRLLGARPKEYTYRWAYHPVHQVHVLFALWPLQPDPVQLAVAIPEGEGAALLDFLVGESDIYITLQPIKGELEDTMTAEAIAALTNGLTAGLLGVRFRRYKGEEP